MSDNLECLNGKLNALNRFISQLKELNSWVIIKKLESEEFNLKPISERKLAIEKLQVCLFLITLTKVYLELLNDFIYQ